MGLEPATLCITIHVLRSLPASLSFISLSPGVVISATDCIELSSNQSHSFRLGSRAALGTTMNKEASTEHIKTGVYSLGLPLAVSCSIPLYLNPLFSYSILSYKITLRGNGHAFPCA